MHKRPIDIIDEIVKTKGKKKKIEKLHEYSKDIKQILNLAYNPKIKWLIPEGIPPFKSSKDDAASTAPRFYSEFKKIDKFLNIGPYPNLAPARREKIFIEMLEYLHPDDAVLICNIKDGKLPIEKSLVEEAFPLLAEKWKT